MEKGAIDPGKFTIPFDDERSLRRCSLLLNVLTSCDNGHLGRDFYPVQFL